KGQAWRSLEKESNIEIVEQTLEASAIEEYARGIGLDAEQIGVLKTQPVKVVEERESGVRAVIGASHMQFVMWRETARQIIPLPSEYALNKDEDAYLNQQVDRLGLLHLSTLEPFVYHMGNRLDEHALAEIRRLGLAEIINQPLTAQGTPYTRSLDPVKLRAFLFISRLSRWSVFRNLTRRLYNFLFEFFAQEK
ncbi:MAG TPA: hypothetical protein VII97_01670, partial [Anaerolineales bacterium]